MVRLCTDLSDQEFDRFCDAVKKKFGNKTGNRTKFAHDAIMKMVEDIEKVV